MRTRIKTNTSNSILSILAILFFYSLTYSYEPLYNPTFLRFDISGGLRNVEYGDTALRITPRQLGNFGISANLNPFQNKIVDLYIGYFGSFNLFNKILDSTDAINNKKFIAQQGYQSHSLGVGFSRNIIPFVDLSFFSGAGTAFDQIEYITTNSTSSDTEAVHPTGLTTFLQPGIDFVFPISDGFCLKVGVNYRQEFHSVANLYININNIKSIGFSSVNQNKGYFQLSCGLFFGHGINTERERQKNLKRATEIKNKIDTDSLMKLSTELNNINMDCSTLLLSVNSFESIFLASNQSVQSLFQSRRPDFARRADSCNKYFSKRVSDSLNVAMENAHALIDTSSYKSISQFMLSFPESKHIAHLDSLKASLLAFLWQRCRSYSNIDSLHLFFLTFKETKYADSAKSIALSIAQAEINSALSSNDIGMLDSFISKYSQYGRKYSELIDVARKQMFNIATAQKATNDSIVNLRDEVLNSVNLKQVESYIFSFKNSKLPESVTAIDSVKKYYITLKTDLENYTVKRFLSRYVKLVRKSSGTYCVEGNAGEALEKLVDAKPNIYLSGESLVDFYKNLTGYNKTSRDNAIVNLSKYIGKNIWLQPDMTWIPGNRDYPRNGKVSFTAMNKVILDNEYRLFFNCQSGIPLPAYKSIGICGKILSFEKSVTSFGKTVIVPNILVWFAFSPYGIAYDEECRTDGIIINE